MKKQEIENRFRYNDIHLFDDFQPGGMNGGGSNGRCGSVPPHPAGGHYVDVVHANSNGTTTYLNGSPFASPSPRPPSNGVGAPPPPLPSSGGADVKSFSNGTAHPNGPPGYPSPVPHQSSHRYPPLPPTSSLPESSPPPQHSHPPNGLQWHCQY